MLNYLDSDSDLDYDEILGKTFLNKYHCIRRLGEGSFGQIYEATYKSEKYALKFETRIKNYNLLQNEAAIINYLKGPNIPYVKSYGFTSNYNILVMQLLGKSLETLLMERKTFSLKTVCLLGYQMVNILEYIHDKHILHRDIKPDNFVMGLNELSNNVYIIDFGLAKKYRSLTTLVQYPMVKKDKLTGTARYASINALKGYEHSRRDDLESVGYILIYFLKGKLPWQGINAMTRDEKYKKILEKKSEINSYELCRGFPKEFGDFLEICKNLKYEERPDYEKMRNLFDNIMKRENYIYDYIYDWTTLEEKEFRKNNRTKTEPTNGDTSSYNEKEKKIDKIDNDKIIIESSYRIQRNNKIFDNNLANHESAVCCSSTCLIF
jgi:serine/threonine protein kinase